MDTTDTLQIEITKAKALLPKESREAIDNVNWKLTILNMNKKYNPDQLENLETETELLLCGILNPEDYPKELAKRMKLTRDESVKLVEEMNELIFKKIQEDLEKRLIVKDKNETKENKPLILDPHFASMPKNVQEAIAQSNWKERLYNIAGKHKLKIAQMGDLEEVTIKVILNEIHPDKYEEELSSKIKMGKEEMTDLVKDINDNILVAIRENEKNIIKEGASPEVKLKVMSEKNEEIPLPPYKAPVKPKMVVVNIPESTNNVKKIEDIKPVESIQKISEPQKNIIEEKLTGATVSERTVSDYTTPQTNNSTPRSHDPYHEPIE